MDRRKHLCKQVDTARCKGLEIGPLHRPTVTRDMGAIYYMDHLPTEELRRKYANDPDVDVAEIAPVDFVWGERPMAVAAAAEAPFDYVVGAHVLEHVPDLIGWLDEVKQVLRPGGVLSLCVPDRRFTFDVRRRPSDISEVVEAHLLGLRQPALRATFDHFYRHVEVDTPAIWRGLRGHNDPPPDGAAAMTHVKAAVAGEYIDTHCWVFSPEELVDLLGVATDLGFIDMQLVDLDPTTPDHFEFFATLKRLPDAMQPEERRQICMESIREFTAQLAPSGRDGRTQVFSMALSRREMRLVRMKRQAMQAVRRTIRASRRELAGRR